MMRQQVVETVCKKTSWWNVKLTKQQPDKTASWWNAKSTVELVD